MIHVTLVESAARPNSVRMSGNAGSIRSIPSAVIAMSAVTRAMNSRPLASPRGVAGSPGRVSEAVCVTVPPYGRPVDVHGSARFSK